MSALNRTRSDLWTAAFVLGLLVAILFAWTSSDAFRFDDASHILFASRHPWWGMLADPELAYRFSRSNYTPFNTLIYEIGLTLFRDEIRAYYLLHVAVLWVTALSTYLLLRRGLSSGVALAATALFLASPATWYVVGQLTVHHYVLGLLFAVLHTNFLLAHLASRRLSSLVASVGCYLFAALCKETYVLWPGALIFLPVATWSQRVKALAWHAPAVALYACLRFGALGGLGGYSTVSQPHELWQSVQGLVVVPAVMLGYNGVAILAIAILAALVVVAWVRHRRGLCLFAFATLLAIAPLVMLVKYPGLAVPDRYYFLPWWLMAVAVGFSSLLVKRRGMWVGAVTVFMWAAAAHTHRQAQSFMPVMRDFDALNGLLAMPTDRPRVVVLPRTFPIGYVRDVSMRYAVFLRDYRGVNNLLVTNAAEAAKLEAAQYGVWELDQSSHRMLRRGEPASVTPVASRWEQVAWNYELSYGAPELLPGYFFGRMGGRVTDLTVDNEVIRGVIEVDAVTPTAYLKALAPFRGQIASRTTLPHDDGKASFAFELRADDPSETQAILQRLCVAVSFDCENFVMIQGMPEKDCSRYLRSSNSAN